jgi:hypothetical protein
MDSRNISRMAPPRGRQFTIALCTGIAALTCSLMQPPAARADSLTFNRTPASNVVSKLDRYYGIDIQLTGSISPDQSVTFSIFDPSGSDGRTQALTAFGTALQADFTKTFVITPAKHARTSAIPVDNNDEVTFTGTAVSAKSAIAQAADADSAVTKIYGNIEGAVLLSDNPEPLSKAVAEIAKQTHTRWTATYVFTPREGSTQSGRVIIGYNGAGQPITEDTMVYHFPKSPPPTAAESNPSTAASETKESGKSQTPANEQANGNNPANANGMTQAPATNFPYGYPYNGFSTYGYPASGYGYSPSGYPSYGYTPGYSGYGYPSTGYPSSGSPAASGYPMFGYNGSNYPTTNNYGNFGYLPAYGYGNGGYPTTGYGGAPGPGPGLNPITYPGNITVIPNPGYSTPVVIGP